MRIIIGSLVCIASPLLAENWPDPVRDDMYRAVSQKEAALGQLLFYDPLLSGNKNISCATCHHPKFATGDGVALSLGEGGIGLGPERTADAKNMPEQRIPRHAQALFNLGASEFTVLFHDGRIEVDPDKPGGLRTPLDSEMTQGFSSLLSAQTMFPVLSQDEMAGHYSENDVSQAVRLGRITGPGGAWDLIAKRVSSLPEYASAFLDVYPEITDASEITFTDISNAIAGFIEFEWRADDSLFDAALRGDAVLPEPAQRGAEMFYGKAECSTCHSGAFQTDHGFHAMGLPQFGPGKAARFESHARDTGRMRVTGNPDDAYAFRTPSLRNVSQTAPYGHTGAYADLSNFIAAHTKPKTAISGFDRNVVRLPDLGVNDWNVLDDPIETKSIAEAASKYMVSLNESEISDLVAFLKTLDDETALKGRLGIPESVPSGLKIDR